MTSSEHVTLLRRPLPPAKRADSRGTPPTTKARLHAAPAVSSPPSPHRPSHHAPVTSPVTPPPPDLFCLNDFLCVGSGAPDRLRKTVLSRQNYRKLLRLFLSELHRSGQSEPANQTLSCKSLPCVTHRTPQRQSVYELAAVVQMEARARDSLRRSCSQTSEDPSAQRRAPHTHTHHELHAAHEVLLNAVTHRLFQGSRRSGSPFGTAGVCDAGVCDSISASELAVLECVTSGGTRLSLKAHFTADLPDISSLCERLQHLNASYNLLTHIPPQVCDLHQLQVLKMRSNPIEELPDDISRLQRLNTLVLSFCKITQLNTQLFSLPCLQHLDVSYNLLRSVSGDVARLRSLRSLNVEGNQLCALPAALLRVSLSDLRISGNYTHALLWSENSRNVPQTLLHTAAHTLAHTHTPTLLPAAARALLRSAGVCDACAGPMFGAGLKLIRGARGVFGLDVVPLLFMCCSPACLRTSRTHSISAGPAAASNYTSFS